MKIQILTQGVKRLDIMKQGLEIAKNYAKTIGLNFEFSFKETSKKFHSFSFENHAVGHATAVDGWEILAETDPGNKVACLIFDWDVIKPKPTNPVQIPILSNGCNVIQIPEGWYNIYPEVLADYFLHELCHSGFFFKDDVVHDITHAQQGLPQWSNKQPHEYYLWLLQDLKQYLEPMPKLNTEPTLRLRSTNKEAVKRLQALLGVSIDGAFGPKTLQAVIDFQKSKGLIADGIVGAKTWAELKKKLF